MTDVTTSSGNVYEDLELPDAEEMLSKANIVLSFSHDMQRILRGQFRRYSVDELAAIHDLVDAPRRRAMEELTRLGQEMDATRTSLRVQSSE